MYNTMLAINNFFERTAEVGDYVIDTNAITTVRGTYLAGQYVRIMGSILNDGVYEIATVGTGTITLTEDLTDESFYGYIVGLVVPNEFVTLAAQVEAYDTGNHAGVSSESIPNYSVSFNNINGVTVSGVQAYSAQLSKYRKPYISPYYFLNWVVMYG